MNASILVPLNGMVANESVLPIATMLSNAAGTRLVLLRVVSSDTPPTVTARDRQQFQEHCARAYLAGLAASLHRQGLENETCVEWAYSDDDMPATIAQVAAIRKAKLIILPGTLREGWAQRFVPSLADRVVAASSVPVLQIRPETGPFHGKSVPVGTSLLVLLDGSFGDGTVILHAAELARSLHAGMVLIYAVSPLTVLEPFPYIYRLIDDILGYQCNEARSYLARIASRLRQQGLTVRARVVIGGQVQAVLEESTLYRSAIIVLAAGCPRLFQRAICGNTVDRLLGETACPVISVNGERQNMSKGVFHRAHALPYLYGSKLGKPDPA